MKYLFKYKFFLIIFIFVVGVFFSYNVIAQVVNPTVNITATGDVSIGDGSIMIDWTTSSNAYNCLASWPSPSTSVESNGGRLVYPTFTTTYTVSCSSLGGGYGADSVTVTFGLCSSSHYLCVKGTSVSNVDNGSSWGWSCNGSNGGTNASCSEAKQVWGWISAPVVSCTIPSGSSSCEIRLAWSAYPAFPTKPYAIVTDSYGVTRFGGGDSATYVPFSIKIDTVGNTTNNTIFYLKKDNILIDEVTVLATCATNTAWDGSKCASTSVNGVCATTHYNCLAGTSTSNVDGTNSWTWSCNGLNGGTNALNCSETKPTQSYPDLVSSVISPLVASAGVAQTYTSTISNQGTVATATSFPYFFQKALGLDSNGNEVLGVTTYSYYSPYGTMGILTAGLASQSSISSPYFSFLKFFADTAYAIIRPSFDTATSSPITFAFGEEPWLRVCADSQDPWSNGAVVNEGPYEGNNCGIWKKVTVKDLDIIGSDSITVIAGQTIFETYNAVATNISSVDWLPDVSRSPALTNNNVLAYRNPQIDASNPFTTVLTVTAPSSITTTTTGTVTLNAKDSAGSTAKSKTINVTVIPTKSDLTAGTVTPTSANSGVAQNYSATIFNIGDASTVDTFSYFFQTSDDEALSNLTDLQSGTIAALSAGGSATATTSSPVSFIYDGVAIPMIRVCADMEDSAGAGAVIDELNEGNNCGPWTLINVAPPLTLTVTKAGTGSGTVSSSPVGISCGADCTETYNYNTSVVLTATPASNSVFTGWSGACTNTTGTCTVSMTTNKTATANFALMTGTLTAVAPSCTIAAGSSSCNIALSWTTTNPIGTSAITATEMTSYSGNNGSYVSFVVPYNGRTFYLYNNSIKLAETSIITASCVANTTWDTVTGTCKTNTYTVTPTAGTGGAIFPTSSKTVSHGATTQFTITPSTGYSLGPVSGNCPVGSFSGNIYTTGAIIADCTVSATFVINTYTVTSGISSAGGSIFPNAMQTVPYGTQKSFTITPDVQYSLGPVESTCGGSLSLNTYTTDPITADCTVGASFASGTLSATSCIIPTTGSACNTTLSWTTTNAISGVISAVTTPTNMTVATGNSDLTIVTGSKIYTVNYGTRDFYLYNNGYQLSTTKTAIASCDIANHYSWGVSSCVLETHTVTPSAGTGCTIFPATPQTSVPYNSTKSFTVTPNTGYSIGSVGGTCGGSLSGNTYTTNPVIVDCTVSASCTIITNTLTVTKTGTGTGIVSSSPVGISCGATCSATYNYGTSVVLTATPASNSVFTGWSGACTNTTGTCTVSMTTNKTATANFALMTGTLTAVAPSCTIAAGASSCNIALSWTTTNPVATSAITATGMTNYIGNTGNYVSFVVPYNGRTFYLYNNGLSLVPTAESPNGSGLNVSANCAVNTMWDGTICISLPAVDIISTPSSVDYGGSSTISWTSDRATSCSISTEAEGVFTGLSGSFPTDALYTSTQYTVYCNNVAGTVSDSVTVVPGLAPYGDLSTDFSSCIIDAGASTCNVKFTWNTYNIMSGYTSAITSPSFVGNVFTGNSGSNLSHSVPFGSSTYYLYHASYLLAQTSVTASCAANTTWDTGTETCKTNTFTVTGTAGAGGTISPTSRLGVVYGTSTTFTVTPNTGYTASASGCGGTLSGTTYTTGVITAGCTVSATFTINTNTLTVTKAGTGTGTVTSSPVGISCGADCTEIYNYGTSVVLTATPTSNSVFTGWSGACTNTSGTCTATMTANKTATANFALMTGTLTSPNCVIAEGSSSCDVPFSWSITNPVGSSTAITASGMTDQIVTTTLTSPQSGTKSISIPYISSPRIFYLYNNGVQLASDTQTATCVVNTTWNGSACVASPTVTTTSPVTSITQTTATGGGNTVSNGGSIVTVAGLVWSTSANPTTADSKTTDGWAIGGPWTSVMTGLTCGTTYHVRAYATNSVGTSYGADVTFTTSACNAVPTLDAPTATSITTTSATLGANVISLGIPASISARGTCLGTTPAPTTNCVAATGTTTGVFTHLRTGLTPGVLYYYRGYATNATGTGYSIDGTFTTSSNAPTVTTTSPVTSITQTTATGGGNTVSNGGSTVTVAGLVWSTSANPTTADSKTTNGWAIGGPWTSVMTGLTNNTLYHVRAYATNSINTSYGDDVTFTTTTNISPVANAGVDKAITLPTNSSSTTGTASDSDGTIVSTIWSFRSGPTTSTISNGSTLTPTFNNMTTAGTYVFRLTVTDNLNGVDFDEMNVVVSPAPSGTLTATSCTIASGASGCTSVLNWTTQNLTANPTEVTRNNPINTHVSYLTSGTNVNNTINYGSTTFYLYHNEVLLAQSATLNTTCITGTLWNGISCAPTEVVTGTLTISPSSCVINKDESTCTVTGATWSTTNVDNPLLVDGNTGNVISNLPNKGIPLKVWVAYPSTVFNLKDGETLLSTKTVTATCESGSVWIGNKCALSPTAFDLSADAPTPSAALINTALTFSSVIHNYGSVSTGATFPNFFQIATSANGGGTITDYTPATPNPMPILSASGTATATSLSHTFTTAGTYSVRACANKSDRNTFGITNELNTNNNCSAWTDVVVGTSIITTGTLTPSAPDYLITCEIPLGASNCSLPFDWSVQNPVGETIIVKQDGTQIPPPLSGVSGNISFTVPFNGAGFSLYNNDTYIPNTNRNVWANCGLNQWDGSKCVISTTGISVTISASPSYLVSPANETTLVWQTSGGPTSCTATYSPITSPPSSWTGPKAVGGGSETITVSTDGTHTYTISCSNATDTVTATTRVLVNVEAKKPSIREN